MCGRYVSVSSPTILAERFKVETVRVGDERGPNSSEPNSPEPNYNVTPRTEVPVVAESHGERVLDLVRWGLVPSWAKDMSIGDRLINARAESIATSNAYKRAFERRRCLIPADGFYEWEKLEGRKAKQPWFIRRRDGEPLAFAGLWEVWHDRSLGEGEPGVRTCVIITTSPNELVAPIHDRMPVVLPESAWDSWLDRDNHDVPALGKLLVPAPAEQFEAWPVSKLVNKPSNNGPELLELPPVDSE